MTEDRRNDEKYMNSNELIRIAYITSLFLCHYKEITTRISSLLITLILVEPVNLIF